MRTALPPGPRRVKRRSSRSGCSRSRCSWSASCGRSPRSREYDVEVERTGRRDGGRRGPCPRHRCAGTRPGSRCACSTRPGRGSGRPSPAGACCRTSRRAAACSSRCGCRSARRRRSACSFAQRTIWRPARGADHGRPVPAGSAGGAASRSPTTRQRNRDARARARWRATPCVRSARTYPAIRRGSCTGRRARAAASWSSASTSRRRRPASRSSSISRGPPAAADEAAGRAAGIGRSTLAAGGVVMLATCEATGPVCELVDDARTLGRRLARAGAGRPPDPPEGWPALWIRVDPETIPSPAAPPPRIVFARPARDPITGAPMSDRRPLMRSGSPWPTVACVSAIALGAIGAIAAPRLGLPALLGAIGGAHRRGARGARAAVDPHAARHDCPARRRRSRRAASRVATRGIEQRPAHGLGGRDAVRARPRRSRRRRDGARTRRERGRCRDGFRRQCAAAVTIAVLVAIVAVVVVPPVTQRLGRHVWPGLTPPFGAGATATASLRGEDRLDMTSRPRLTDKVVFTVEADKAQFWRGEMFDVWDGTTWTRSDPRLSALPRNGMTAHIMVDPFDDGGRSRDVVTPDVPHLDELFRHRVRSAEPGGGRDRQGARRTARRHRGCGRRLRQGRGVHGPQPIGAADRERPAGPQTTRAVPQAVLDRYASPPPTTARVRALAGRIAADAPTTYDKIRAFEAWLGDEHQVLARRAAVAARRRRGRPLPVHVAARLVRAGREQPGRARPQCRDSGPPRHRVRARRARRAHRPVRRARARRARVDRGVLPGDRLAGASTRPRRCRSRARPRPTGRGSDTARRNALAFGARARPRACCSSAPRPSCSRGCGAGAPTRRGGWAALTLAAARAHRAHARAARANRPRRRASTATRSRPDGSPRARRGRCDARSGGVRGAALLDRVAARRGRGGARRGAARARPARRANARAARRRVVPSLRP